MPRRPLLGNHQKCWVRGRHAVLGALRCGWDPYELRLAETADPAAADEARMIAESRGVPVVPANAANLTKLCGRDHQGFAAKMPPFPYADADALFAAPPPLTVLADGVQDPHNLGAILRSAAEFAADAILLPATNAVGVTAGVVQSGAGAVGHVPIARAPDVAAVLRTMKSRGARVAAAAFAADAVPPWEADLTATPARPAGPRRGRRMAGRLPRGRGVGGRDGEAPNRPRRQPQRRGRGGGVAIRSPPGKYGSAGNVGCVKAQP